MKTRVLSVKIDEATHRMATDLRRDYSLNVSEFIRHSLRAKYDSLTASGAAVAPFPADSPQAAL